MDEKTLQEVVSKVKSPAYLFDLDILKERVLLIQETLKPAKTCFAMKANPFLVGPMNEYTDRFEVCSPGEYEICMRQKIPAEKIVVSGVNKTEQSMDRILELSGGKGIFTMESEKHFEVLSACTEKKNCDIEVYLRLSSGNQFGMDKETLERVLVRCQEDAHIRVIGIHYYSGTQKKIKKVEKEIAMLAEYGAYLKQKYGLCELELEYGPGLSVAYFENETVTPAKEQLRALKEILESTDVFSAISIEMGRFIASDCGYYITGVVDVKHTEDTSYLIMDGGIHQINYYGQIMGMKKPVITYFPKREENIGKYHMCGSLCTVNDVMVRDLEIGEPHPGDIMVFHTCGGYSVTEGMALFLSRELPQIVFYSGNKGLVCVREQMGTDIINSQMEEK